MPDTDPTCRFCLQNHLLIDTPLAGFDLFYVLGSIDPKHPHQVMVVPRRHIVTPFDLTPDEWIALGSALTHAKTLLAPARPDGYTIGWNVNAVAGQEVFHAHLHVIARFVGEYSEGLGLHALFRSTNRT